MSGPGEKNVEEAIFTVISPSLLTTKKLNYTNSGTTTSDYPVFDEDIEVKFNGKITLQISMSVSTTVQVKINDSVSYLNSGKALSANSLYEYDITVSEGDTLNVIIQVPAGDTLTGLLRLFRRNM